MTCRECADAIDIWTKNGKIIDANALSVKNHIVACPECRNRYGFLVPLLLRDTATLKRDLRRNSGANQGFDVSNQVIYKIFGRKLDIQSKQRMTRMKVLAAAAVLILAAIPLAYLHVKQSREATIVVSFRLIAPEAKSVRLVGDFTEWSPEGIKMVDRRKNGIWETEVRLKKGVTYRYNFVLDGMRWITDPDSLIQLNDDFGGLSSLIQL